MIKTAAPRYFPTLGAIAKYCDVSEHTLHRWRSKYDDFPTKEEKGYARKAIDKWLADHRIGPYADTGPATGRTLTASRIELTEEKIRRERAEATIKEIDLAELLGKIWADDDVRRLFMQTAGAVREATEGLHDMHDRELPEKCPTSDTWPALRRRILEIDAKLLDTVAATVREIEL